MAKRVLTLQHVWDDPVGMVGTLLQEYGIEFDVINVEQERIPDPTRYDALIAFGGSQHAYDDQHYPYFGEEKALIRATVEHDIPYLGIKHRWVQFDMILQAVSSQSIAKCLIACMCICGEMNSTCGKLKNILVPLKDLLIARQTRVERVTLPLGC